MPYVRITRVVVTPLNKQMNSTTNFPNEYTVSFRRPAKYEYDDTQVNLEQALESIGKMIHVRSGLTYSYKVGDKAIFDVRYRTQRKQILKSYKFVTGVKP